MFRSLRKDDESITMDDIDAFFEEMDRDRDGLICWEEYQQSIHEQKEKNPFLQEVPDDFEL